MASRGWLMDILDLPGFVAEEDGAWLGYAAYDLRDGQMEMAVLESTAPSGGVAGGLVAACVSAATAGGADRLWLVTTNHNTAALRWYQRRGFVLSALHRDAVSEARRTIKREIPERGNDDIPIRDELELELPRADWQDFVERHAWPRS